MIKMIDKVIAIENQLELLIQDLDLVIENDQEKELYYERVDKRAIEKILENLRETFDRSEYSESEFMKQFLWELEIFRNDNDPKN